MLEKLFIKLAVERCRLALAQLCAASHLGLEEGEPCPYGIETINGLIAQIDRDISLIERISVQVGESSAA